MTAARRILLTVGYDGTRYSGWQRQLNGPGIQSEIERALSRAEKREARVTGASRTDAGVHARGQRVHFDTESRIPAEKYPFVFNTLLPPDIRVTAAREVDFDLHARFSAKGKIYTYRIDNAPHPDAVGARFRAHQGVRLDETLMRLSALHLVGTHDFAAFEASGGTSKTTVRTIRRMDVERLGDFITLTTEGTAFLYNMVRIIAGTLMYVGMGRLSPDCTKRALQTGDRLLLGPTAPAKGLELTKVYYEGEPHGEENGFV